MPRTHAHDHRRGHLVPPSSPVLLTWTRPCLLRFVHIALSVQVSLILPTIFFFAVHRRQLGVGIKALCIAIVVLGFVGMYFGLKGALGSI